MNIPEDVILLGRSFNEYVQIFHLSESDLRKRILGVGDGPSSFNADATRKGYRITSVDPCYRLGPDKIRDRFQGVQEGITSHLENVREKFDWSYHKSPEGFRAHNVATLDRFLRDLPAGRRSGRYVAGALPRLPFRTGAFDLALCGHLLFLYSGVFESGFHRQSILEMLRVASEVRIFPLIRMDSMEDSEYLEPTIKFLTRQAMGVELRRVSARFHKSADKMLVVKQQ